ncbi:MAG: PqqD family protein [Myxococcota bacterium]
MKRRDEQTYRVRDQVLSRMLDDEVVLLDLASGTYFGLNEVGAEVWQLLEREADVAAIRNHLAATFATGRDDDVDGDLDQLLEELQRRGLIEPREGSPS